MAAKMNLTASLYPLPTKAKRKPAKKARNTKYRQELIARLFNWQYIEYSNDLAVVRPPSFIIDNKSIVKSS